MLKSKSTGLWSKSTNTSPSRFRVSRSGHGLGNESLTSSYDVSLMWTKADVEVLAWLLTWSDDVR